MAVKSNLKKKVQMQNMIILAMTIVIVVLLVVSATAAWYIRTKTDSADIILSNPVNIYITEFTNLKDSLGNDITGSDGKPIKKHELKTDILEEYNTRVYPGDKIKLQLGMQIGSQEVEASPAYVRVKLVLTWENIYTGEVGGLEGLAGSNMIEYKDAPDDKVWQKIDFNKFVEGDNVEHDYWWVLKETDSHGNIKSKIARNMEQYEFVDGYIELSKTEITNAQANCKFHINYVVEAIQTVNVSDPLVNEGFGPWWGNNNEAEL